MSLVLAAKEPTSVSNRLVRAFEISVKGFADRRPAHSFSNALCAGSSNVAPVQARDRRELGAASRTHRARDTQRAYLGYVMGIRTCALRRVVVQRLIEVVVERTQSHRSWSVSAAVALAGGRPNAVSAASPSFPYLHLEARNLRKAAGIARRDRPPEAQRRRADDQIVRPQVHAGACEGCPDPRVNPRDDLIEGHDVDGRQ